MEDISEGLSLPHQDGEADTITGTMSQQQDLGMGLPSGGIDQVSLIVILNRRVVRGGCTSRLAIYAPVRMREDFPLCIDVLKQ